MIQFDEHIFQMGWFNHQLVTLDVFIKSGGHLNQLPSPKLTYIAPENWWLEDDPFLLGELFVSGSLEQSCWL